MNLSNLYHALYAMGFQFFLGIATGNFWLGMAFGSAFFLGREVAQREYKLTKGASVKELKPWAGFDILNWGWDAKLDLLFPVLGTTLVAIAVHCR
jgi:hypothetical protein